MQGHVFDWAVMHQSGIGLFLINDAQLKEDEFRIMIAILPGSLLAVNIVGLLLIW
jgi:hypothetical protein